MTDLKKIKIMNMRGTKNYIVTFPVPTHTLFLYFTFKGILRFEKPLNQLMCKCTLPFMYVPH